MSLRGFLNFLIACDHSATKELIRLAANTILKNGGMDKRLDAQWATRWFKRNKHWYRANRTKSLAAERKGIHTQEDIEEHFALFQEVCQATWN